MSRFDERVLALIDDRVNDLERLFLPSEKTSTPAGMDECCQEVLDKVRDIHDKVDNIQQELREKVNDDDNHQNNPYGPDDAWHDFKDQSKEFWHRFKDWLFHNHPEALPAPGDNLPVPMGDTNVPSDPWAEFWKFLYDVLDGGISASPADLIGMILKFVPVLGPYINTIQLLLTALDLIKHSGNPEDIDWEKLLEVLLSKVDKVEQRLDSLAPVIAGLTTPGGGEASIMLDRLQNILDDTDQLLHSLSDLDTAMDRAFSRQNADLRENFNLMRADYVVMRSEIACVKMWISGERSCEEFQEDLFSIAQSLRTTTTAIKCSVDQYYTDIMVAFNTHCSDLTRKVDKQTELITDMSSTIGSGVEGIQGSVEQGNVVGTGSIVLNLKPDLDVIKSMLIDIRRLL